MSGDDLRRIADQKDYPVVAAFYRELADTVDNIKSKSPDHGQESGFTDVRRIYPGTHRDLRKAEGLEPIDYCSECWARLEDGVCPDHGDVDAWSEQ